MLLFKTFFTTCNFHKLLFTGPGRPGFNMGRKSSMYVRLSFFLSFFLSLCMSIRPSVNPSVHLSFFPSLTSPSSLAPFSVSLIYTFLVFFSSSHVIGLLNMCSNVHTTAYVQLLDYFFCQIFFANLHLKYMISNFNLFEGFFVGNKWSQIG